MSEMIERVARAIYLDRYPDENWDDVSDFIRRDYRGHAGAAIEAMREPTPGMIDSAGGCGIDFPSQACAAWRKMIDAALADPVRRVAG